MTFSTVELNFFHNFFTVFPPNFSWQRIQVLPREPVKTRLMHRFSSRSGVGASRWLARTVRMALSRGKKQSEPWAKEGPQAKVG